MFYQLVSKGSRIPSIQRLNKNVEIFKMWLNIDYIPTLTEGFDNTIICMYTCMWMNDVTASHVYKTFEEFIVWFRIYTFVKSYVN